jgi:hypothetical protein
MTDVTHGNRLTNGTTKRRLLGSDKTAPVQTQQHQGRPALHLAIPTHSQQVSAMRTVTARRTSGLVEGWVRLDADVGPICGSPALLVKLV